MTYVPILKEGQYDSGQRTLPLKIFIKINDKEHCNYKYSVRFRTKNIATKKMQYDSGQRTLPLKIFSKIQDKEHCH